MLCYLHINICVPLYCTIQYNMYTVLTYTALGLYSCDAEYARRVQLQNEWVIRQVENMEDYKHSLLFTLASNPDACVSVCTV